MDEDFDILILLSVAASIWDHRQTRPYTLLEKGGSEATSLCLPLGGKLANKGHKESAYVAYLLALFKSW